MRTSMRLVTALAVGGTLLLPAGPALAEERVCRGTIGARTVDNLRGSVQIVQGSTARIATNRITGDILFDEQDGALTARANRIGGNLQAFQNTGGVTISNNRIDGNLQCKENVPAPTGGGNLVQGNKEDQCERL